MYALKAKETLRADVRYSLEEKIRNSALVDIDEYFFDVYLSEDEADACKRLIIRRQADQDTIIGFSIDGIAQDMPLPIWVEKLLAAARTGTYSYFEPRTFQLYIENGLSWYQPLPESTNPAFGSTQNGERFMVLPVYKTPKTQFSLSDTGYQPQEKQQSEISDEYTYPQMGFYAPKEGHHLENQSNKNTKEYEIYIQKLLKATQNYKDNLPGTYATVHRILDELISNLQKKHNSEAIESYYAVLERKEPDNTDTNYNIIKQNQHCSTLRFLAGIAAITLTIITGILPGLIVMGVVYALTNKTPLSLFKTESELFVEKLNEIEDEHSSSGHMEYAY